VHNKEIGKKGWELSSNVYAAWKRSKVRRAAGPWVAAAIYAGPNGTPGGLLRKITSGAGVPDIHGC